MLSAARLCPDPLRELKRSPDHYPQQTGRGWEKGRQMKEKTKAKMERKRGEKEEREGSIKGDLPPPTEGDTCQITCNS